MIRSACWLSLLPALALALPCSAADDEAVSFTRDIRPILSERCFACHGPDEAKREADLRLDLADSALKSGVIKPKDVAHSELWTRITSTDPDVQMPPPDGGKRLTEAEAKLIRAWIESGAKFEQHWSFVGPVKPSVPENGATNPIDAFLRQRMRASGLQPAPLADRRTLIRRATLDLTGLPPTPEEVQAFLNDKSDRAWENLLDNLTSRITHGEHMARYWLDLARYADTHGLHLDNERSMWPYRDWVVRAFHTNLPFDDFTRWQIAGDLLTNPTEDQLIASGFNRCNVSTGEGGSINEEWIFRYAVDRTSTAAEVWMGLTAGCAVCHDHKFDPLSTREYYSMYAFFHSAADPAMDGNRIDTPPVLKILSADDKKRIEDLNRELVKTERDLQDRIAALDYTDPATLDPAPGIRTTEAVWFGDGFPAGAQVQGQQVLVTKKTGEVFRGARALKRTGAGVAQDFYQAGAAPLTVPANGKFFVHCFLDPKNTPETIMIQFHTNGWKHRAVWGAQEKIAFGKPNTTEKVLMGKLPEVGKWVRLEVDGARMGLKGGAKVTGYAFTQFGGTVTWDHMGVSSSVNPAKDPAWSYQVWQKRWAGKRNNALPEGLRQLVRGKQPKDWTDAEATRVRRHWLSNIYQGSEEQLAPPRERKAEIESEKREIEKNAPVTFVMADLPKARDSFVMLRGAYDKPGEKVSRAVPAFLPPLPDRPADRDYNRLDLANWLVSGHHPLTARVTVNRIWQQFFGTGLVRTSADFGSQGTPPTHPELLDYLATRFVEDGWDVRKLVKLILTSHAYRQSSRVTPEGLRVDPENQLLARSPRLRLDAEVLRDQVLFVSGLLVDKIGGKPVKPYQPPNIWEPVAFGGSNTRFYKQDSGDALYRRSMYTFLKRTAPPPFMATFDAPNREQSCSRREKSNTPMQALQLMNDVQHVEAARNLAARTITHGGDTAEKRIRWTWQLVTSRDPSPTELGIARDTLAYYSSRYGGDAAAAKELVSYGESKTGADLDKSELAAWTMVASLILNLDEVVTRN